MITSRHACESLLHAFPQDPIYKQILHVTLLLPSLSTRQYFYMHYHHLMPCKKLHGRTSKEMLGPPTPMQLPHGNRERVPGFTDGGDVPNNLPDIYHPRRAFNNCRIPSTPPTGSGEVETTRAALDEVAPTFSVMTPPGTTPLASKASDS